jgi:hypothetical protein
MSSAETAAVLADALLKGLLSAHHDGRAASAAEWTPSDFLTHTQVLIFSALRTLTGAGHGTEIPCMQPVGPGGTAGHGSPCASR